MSTDPGNAVVPEPNDRGQTRGSGLDLALHHLMSLNVGDQGVLEVVAFGRSAVPRLRHLLFQREPSGLFQPRCRVVQALAALGAREVLLEFLETDRDIPDPVERAGEDAVINAVARTLHTSGDEVVFRRLLRLAATRRLIGPIEVIGTMRRREALHCLVAALEDDLARPVAEDALRNFGSDAAPALLESAHTATRHDGEESESSRRRRRSALQLLSEIDRPAGLDADLRTSWRTDPDAQIALLGCRFALDLGDAAERHAAVQQLIRMLNWVPWNLRRDIADCLVAHASSARPLLEAATDGVVVPDEDRSSAAEVQRCLLRIKRQLEA